MHGRRECLLPGETKRYSQLPLLPANEKDLTGDLTWQESESWLLLLPPKKSLTLMEFSLELRLILTGSQAPSSSQRFQELCSPAGCFGEFVQLHQEKQHAQVPGLYRLGDEVQENLDFLPQPVLKRPGREKKLCKSSFAVFSPPSVASLCIGFAFSSSHSQVSRRNVFLAGFYLGIPLEAFFFFPSCLVID